MTSSFNERLYKVKLKYRYLEKLQRELSDLSERKQTENETLKNFKKTVSKEFKDFKKIEGISLNSLFFTIIGKRDEQKVKEKREYLLASLNYNKSKDELKYLDERIDVIQKKIVQLGNIKIEYNHILIEKEKYLIEGKDKSAIELLGITEERININSKIKELNEALNAGKRVLDNIERILSKLRSAENWGTWDLLGGGLITDLVKHSKIDDAKDLVHKTQFLLNDFKKELKDVDPSNYKIEIGGFASFADFFFDGLIADCIVLNKIENASSNISSEKIKIDNIISTLNNKIQEVTERKKRLNKKRKIMIESA